MSVSCSAPGCNLSCFTARQAKNNGWAILLITVGGTTPRPGTVYLCPEHWAKIRPTLAKFW